MKKNILAENMRRFNTKNLSEQDNEMWDKDPSNRDTYSDYNDERNYEEEEGYANAVIVNKRMRPNSPEYTALIDDKGDEYTNFLVFNTKEELENEMKDPTYGEKAGYYDLPDNKVAVAFHSQESKGEDFGGM